METISFFSLSAIRYYSYWINGQFRCCPGSCEIGHSPVLYLPGGIAMKNVCERALVGSGGGPQACYVQTNHRVPNRNHAGGKGSSEEGIRQVEAGTKA